MTDFIPTTRMSLLGRLVSDEQELAWEEFLEIYQPAIYRIARRRGLQTSAAEDVSQQVMLAALRKIPTWQTGEGSLRAWLLLVTRNILHNELTRRRADRGIGGDRTQLNNMVEQFSQDDQEQQVDWEYRRAMFRYTADRLKDHLSEFAWKSFWLTAVEGLKPGEVAAELGISIGAVYTNKCRVLKKFREFVRNAEGENEC